MLSVFWQGGIDSLRVIKFIVVLGSLQSDNNPGKSLMHSDIFLTCTASPINFETVKTQKTWLRKSLDKDPLRGMLQHEFALW